MQHAQTDTEAVSENDMDGKQAIMICDDREYSNGRNGYERCALVLDECNKVLKWTREGMYLRSRCVQSRTRS